MPNESSGERTLAACQPSAVSGSNLQLPDDLELFVIVHDQDILLRCEARRRFVGIPRRRYLFVGMRPIDKLTGRSDVVIARDLPENIEDQPNLLSFTGWYAIVRNNLATTRYLSLLEYDVALRPAFYAQTLAALREQRGLVGYVPHPLSHPRYLHATPWLISALAEVYQVDAVQLVHDHLAAGGIDQWSATSNASMDLATLRAVVDWLLPLTRVYSHAPIGAHVHERALKIFSLLGNCPSCYLPGLLKHARKESHRIPTLSLKEARRRALPTGIKERKRTWSDFWRSLSHR